MSDLTVVQAEAAWLTAQPGVLVDCGKVEPYVLRIEGNEDRQVRLRRTATRISTFDTGSDLLEHDLLLLLSWPLANLTGAQQFLDRAVDRLVTTLRTEDRSHGGLWLNSADSGEFGGPDMTVTFDEPSDAVLLNEDGRLTATVGYTVEQQRPRTFL